MGSVIGAVDLAVVRRFLVQCGQLSNLQYYNGLLRGQHGPFKRIVGARRREVATLETCMFLSKLSDETRYNPGSRRRNGPFDEYKSEQGAVRLQNVCNLLRYSADFGIGVAF